MPRRCIQRRVGYQQEVSCYKPAGIPLTQIEVSVVTLDEMEAMRLVDSLSLSQTEAAEKMGVSQPTVARLLETGRCTVVSAIVDGQAFSIKGGPAPVEFYGFPEAKKQGWAGAHRGRQGKKLDDETSEKE